MTQSFGEQVAILSPVKAELHLRQIPGKVLGRDFVPTSHDATLEQRKRRFDRIRVNVSFDIDASRMLDGLVLRPHVAKQRRSGIVKGFGVAAGIVRHNHFNRTANMLLNELRQRPAFNVVNVEESQIAAALPDAEHYVFVGTTSALPAALDSADVGFVQFDGAGQWRTFNRRHCEADAMAQVPCGLVAHADGSLELIRRHALAGFAEQQDGEKPRFEGQLRIPEDRACSDAELVMAGITDQDRAASGHFALAPDTFRSDGPAQTLQQVPATIFIGETRHEITKSHSSSHQKASRRDQETVEGKGEGGLTYRLCRGLAGRSVRTESHGRRSFFAQITLAITKERFTPITSQKTVRHQSSALTCHPTQPPVVNTDNRSRFATVDYCGFDLRFALFVGHDSLILSNFRDDRFCAIKSLNVFPRKSHTSNPAKATERGNVARCRNQVLQRHEKLVGSYSLKPNLGSERLSYIELALDHDSPSTLPRVSALMTWTDRFAANVATIASLVKLTVLGSAFFARNAGAGFGLTELREWDFRTSHLSLLPASHAGFNLMQDQHSKWNKTCQVNNRERF